MAVPTHSSHSQSIRILGPHPRLDEIVADTFSELGWELKRGSVGSLVATTPSNPPPSSGETVVVELKDTDLVVVTSKHISSEKNAGRQRNVTNVRAFLSEFKRQIEQRPVTLARREAQEAEEESGKTHRKLLGVLALLAYTFGPVLCVVVAGLIATALDCRISEAGGDSCYCFGIDIGPTLTGMGVMGWLMLLTLPTGIPALLFIAVFTRD